MIESLQRETDPEQALCPASVPNQSARRGPSVIALEPEASVMHESISSVQGAVTGRFPNTSVRSRTNQRCTDDDSETASRVAHTSKRRRAEDDERDYPVLVRLKKVKAVLPSDGERAEERRASRRDTI